MNAVRVSGQAPADRRRWRQILIRGAGVASCALTLSLLHAKAQSLSDPSLLHDPAKRSEIALNEADRDFDSAREAYDKGNINGGDAELDNMTKALNICLESLEAAHKSRFYKRAELRVATLQRRMSALLDDIDLPQRGWAEFTNRKLDEIHDSLLAGVMRK